MIKFPNKKYNIIYADPPWSFGSKSYQDGNRDIGDISVLKDKVFKHHVNGERFLINFMQRFY